jgi:hypothetical protein
MAVMPSSDKPPLPAKRHSSRKTSHSSFFRKRTNDWWVVTGTKTIINTLQISVDCLVKSLFFVLGVYFDFSS